MNKIPKIVSGGQTGADRAALDWALSHNLPAADGALRVGKPRTEQLLKVGEKLNEVAVFVPKGIYPKGGC
jgi:hypothetical protein